MWRRLRRLPAFILSWLPVPVAGGSFFQQGADILMAAAASGAWDGVAGSDLQTENYDHKLRHYYVTTAPEAECDIRVSPEYLHPSMVMSK